MAPGATLPLFSFQIKTMDFHVDGNMHIFHGTAIYKFIDI